MHPPAVNPRLTRGSFYGEMLRQHDAGGFSLSQTRYRPGSTLPRHSHESHYVCFVLSGTYKESYERRTRSCQPAMVLYHPAGELHAQYFDKTAVDLFRVEVNPARLRYASQPSLSMDGCDFRGGGSVSLISCIRSFKSLTQCRIWRLKDSASNSSRHWRAIPSAA